MYYNHYLSSHMPGLYAETCPQQPIMLNRSPPEQQQRIDNPQNSKRLSQKAFKYSPNIIKSKKCLGMSMNMFEQRQHKRELQILNKRISNCKSWSQRKKDHNDPIIYPTYFIRQNKRCKDASIDGYYKRIMLSQSSKLMLPHQTDRANKFKRKNKHRRSKENSNELPMESNYSMQNKEYIYLPLPIIPKKSFQLTVAKQTNLNPLQIPDCNSRSTLQFIIEHDIWEQSGLKMLKTRMGHYYGHLVEGVWKEVMYYLKKKNY